MRTHLGNYALWLSGMYPDYIEHRRWRRGGPDLDYYEEMGRRGFQLAAGHRLADDHGLTMLFTTAAERFGLLRAALNDVSDALLFPDRYSPERLMRQVTWRRAGGGSADRYPRRPPRRRRQTARDPTARRCPRAPPDAIARRPSTSRRSAIPRPRRCRPGRGRPSRGRRHSFRSPDDASSSRSGRSVPSARARRDPARPPLRERARCGPSRRRERSAFGHSVGDVLHERSAQCHVQDLHPATDRERGKPSARAAWTSADLECVAPFVHVAQGRVRRGAVACRIDVFATGQDESRHSRPAPRRRPRGPAPGSTNGRVPRPQRQRCTPRWRGGAGRPG